MYKYRIVYDIYSTCVGNAISFVFIVTRLFYVRMYCGTPSALVSAGISPTPPQTMNMVHGKDIILHVLRLLKWMLSREMR